MKKKVKVLGSILGICLLIIGVIKFISNKIIKKKDDEVIDCKPI